MSHSPYTATAEQGISQLEAISSDLDQAIHQIRETIESQYDVSDDGVFDFYDHVKSEWLPEKEPGVGQAPPGPKPPGPIPGYKDPDIVRAQEVFNHTKNAILYGPPGTGKTYIARKVVEAMVDPQLRQALGSAANSRVREHFNHVVSISQLMALFAGDQTVPAQTVRQTA